MCNAVSDKHGSQFAEQSVYISHSAPADADVVLGKPWFDPDDGKFYICTSLGPIVWTEFVAAGAASDISIQNIATAAAINVEDFINTANSTGLISGGVASDGGSGTIDITAGEIYIRATDSNIGELWSAEFAAVTGQALTDNSLNFIWAEYNSGAPQISVSTTPRSDVHRNVILAVVYREGTDVHISNVHIQSSQVHQLLAKRLVFVDAYSRQSGSVTAEAGTRNITVTAGAWWLALLEVATSALDTSSAGRFSYWHQNGGTWTEVATQAAIDNAQYNDTTSGLAALGNNKYGVHWVYLSPESDNYHVVYGVGSYSLTEAEEALAPGTLPPWFNSFHITLIAKIVIKKDASVFISVQNPFDVQFGQAVAENHDDLGNLAWTGSGHTGTATRVAGFEGAGAAAEYTLSGSGTELALTNSPTLVTPALGTPASGVMTNMTGLVNAGVDGAAAIVGSKIVAATSSARGTAELAIASEVSAGTDTGRVITPDALAGSDVMGGRSVQVVAFDFGTSVTTGDGKFYFLVDPRIAGMNIVDVRARNITAGVTGQMDIQLRNVTQSGADILSTKLTIATGAVLDDGNAAISGTEDDLTLDDLIAVDVDAIHSGTAAKGLIIAIGCRLP